MAIRDEIFQEVNQSNYFSDYRTGIIMVSPSTLAEAKSMAVQAMPTDASHIDALFSSIANDGYNCAFPIVLNNDTLTTTDGYCRLTAAIRVVELDLAERIYIPFYSCLEDGNKFNSSTRGTSAADIDYLFKLPRTVSPSGSSGRASKQAIEASMMLDVGKVGNEYLAFQPSRTQWHTSKIVREKDAFINAFVAVCDVCDRLGVNPDDVKWAHWMALFCRYGVNRCTRSIALNHVVGISGTKQSDRYATFKVMASKAEMAKGGL